MNRFTLNRTCFWLTTRYASSARFILAVLIGAVVGVALAQDRPPGQLDAACAAQCAENGNEATFCEQVCWLPDPTVAGRNDPVYWPCYGSCRERGGKPEVCLAACRKR